MRYIVISAGNEGDWFNKDIALVNLTDAVGQKIKRALEFIRLAPEEFKDSIDIDIYGIDVEFLDSMTMEEDDSEDVTKILDVTVNASLGGIDGVIVEVSNYFDVKPFLGDVDYVVYNRAVVSHNSVRFLGNNKYGDGEEIYSESIDVEVIDEYLAGTTPTT